MSITKEYGSIISRLLNEPNSAALMFVSDAKASHEYAKCMVRKYVICLLLKNTCHYTQTILGLII